MLYDPYLQLHLCCLSFYYTKLEDDIVGNLKLNVPNWYV